jgi:hypothetical protein
VQVLEEFATSLDGLQEVPVRRIGGTGRAEIQLNPDGTLGYRLNVANIPEVIAAHIHLGVPGQNGPVVAFLFESASNPVTVGTERQLSAGTIRAADVIPRPGFDGTLATLVDRIRRGEAYVNVHTRAFPGGEIRGQLALDSPRPLSQYSDPEFSWRYEIAPGGIGFLSSRALGEEYENDLFVGAARNFLQGGQLWRLNLTPDRTGIAVDDPRLADRVADNNFKYDITESESLLFGSDFGIVTDIQTGPNGNLYVVSLDEGVVFEIRRRLGGLFGGLSSNGPTLASAGAAGSRGEVDLATAAALLLPDAAGPAFVPLPDDQSEQERSSPPDRAGVDQLSLLNKGKNASIVVSWTTAEASGEEFRRDEGPLGAWLPDGGGLSSPAWTLA